MQETRVSNLWLRLSTSKHFLCSLAILPALAATPVFGQESVLTVAMVSYDQSPARKTATARNDSAVNPLDKTFVPRLEYRIAGLQPNHHPTTALSSQFFLEDQNAINPRDWSQYVCKKTNADGWGGSWVHVEAGYGQFCQFESSLGEKALEMEQPSCAYFKASFSF
jgi:hypothetical protein